jgi:hypothetical protein
VSQNTIAPANRLRLPALGTELAGAVDARRFDRQTFGALVKLFVARGLRPPCDEFCASDGACLLRLDFDSLALEADHRAEPK